ncbi:MAG: DUF167 domain-containing protein [Candidatus Saccharibacteria bacterium]
MNSIQESANGIRIEIKVIPRSSRNQLAGFQDGALKVKLTAPPVEGEANQALIAYLADVFKVSKRDVTIIRGETARNKLVEVCGVTLTQAEQILGKIT